MRTLITIGELAQLFDIKTTKIRFYERRGLLKPEEISASGYRLYSYTDLERLELILLLREMDVPINRIKDMIKGYKEEDYRILLQEMKQETKNQINQLKKKYDILSNRIDHLKNYRHNDMRIIEYPDRYYVEVEEKIDKSMTIKGLFDIHNSLDLKLSNYEDKYIFKLSGDMTLSKGVVTKNKRLSKFPRKVIPGGRYLEVKRKASVYDNFEIDSKSIFEDIASAGYEVESTLYGIEDYRLFLFSNTTTFYTFEVKLKENL